jgi:hypothetical protein
VCSYLVDFWLTVTMRNVKCVGQLLTQRIEFVCVWENEAIYKGMQGNIQFNVLTQTVDLNNNRRCEYS